MKSRDFHLHDGQRGAALAIRVTTRARQNEIVEILNDGTIKVRLKASPVEGKANVALIEFMAQVLEVPKSRVEIIAGETGRDKLISVLNLDAVTAHERILKNLA